MINSRSSAEEKGHLHTFHTNKQPTFKMTILILGGRGKTASRLTALLDEAKVPFIVGSSSDSPKDRHRFTKFNWFERHTWESPFAHVEMHGLDAISSVYLVGPPIMDLAPPMIEFVDLARSHGVQRFVLLSASNIEKGGEAMGQVHAYLDGLSQVEYVALRPTWFMGKLHPREGILSNSDRLLFRKHV